MSLIDVLMAAEASETGAAVRRTAYRHVHLEDDPLIVVAYNLSGEAAAPLGIMYGTDPDTPSLVVSAEPRNRESRFGAINAFAADFADYIKPYLTLKTVPTRDGSFRQVTSNAPQIVVPNRATRSYLGARLGRSLRYLGLGDTHEVPEATQWTGSHLSWFAEHSNLPGQSAFLAMTEALSQHFVTGQSALEDENLATLLAWIDGLPGSALPELERLEDRAYGPVPNPEWEATLEPYVKAYTQGLRAEDEQRTQLAFDLVEQEVHASLFVAYEATHKAIDVLRRIEPAANAASRWSTDLYEWSVHTRRSANGIPRFARRHDALRAARALQRWSSAAEELETQQVFDDPLIMARLDAEGRCLTGTVSSVDDDNREVKPGQVRLTRVPLVDVSVTAPTRLLVDDVVRLADNQKVKGVVRRVDQSTAQIAIVGGIRAFDDLGVSQDSEVVFVGLDPWRGMDPWAPDKVPWTHREATTSDLAGEGEADPAAGAEDDSPDLSVDELAALPIIGTVGPDDEPGSLQ